MPNPAQPPARKLVAKRPPTTYEDSLFAVTGEPARRGFLRNKQDLAHGVLGKYDNWGGKDSLSLPPPWVYEAAQQGNLNVDDQLMHALGDQGERDNTLAHELGHRIDDRNRYLFDHSPVGANPRPDIVQPYQDYRFQHPEKKFPEDAYGAHDYNEQFAVAFAQAIQRLRATNHSLSPRPDSDMAMIDRSFQQGDSIAPGSYAIEQQLLNNEPLYAQHHVNKVKEQELLATRPDATRAVVAKRRKP